MCNIIYMDKRPAPSQILRHTEIRHQSAECCWCRVNTNVAVQCGRIKQLKHFVCSL